MLSFKQELKDTAERLVYGNLAVLEEGVEEYQHAVDQASTITELVSIWKAAATNQVWVIIF